MDGLAFIDFPYIVHYALCGGAVKYAESGQHQVVPTTCLKVSSVWL